MKQLHIFLITMMICVFSVLSCNTNKLDPNYYSASITSITNMSIDTLSVVLVDSVINADKLPIYNKWNKSYFKDAEANKAYEYATIYDRTTGIIYTIKVLQSNKVYVLQKKHTTIK